MSRGKEQAAKAILERLHSTSERVDGESLAHLEFLQIQQQVHIESSKEFGIFDFFRIRSYRKRLMVACGCQYNKPSTSRPGKALTPAGSLPKALARLWLLTTKSYYTTA